jgi:hypothetical protein
VIVQQIDIFLPRSRIIIDPGGTCISLWDEILAEHLVIYLIPLPQTPMFVGFGFDDGDESFYVFQFWRPVSGLDPECNPEDYGPYCRSLEKVR